MKHSRPLKLAAMVLSMALWLALVAWAPPAWSQDANKPEPTTVAKPYHGNLKSKKFHRPGCRYYSCRNCLANFKTREEAIKAGYYPCKVCKP